MKVLLVEKRNGKNHRPNLALARFSSIHKEKGDEVIHLIVDSRGDFPGFEPDKVYISIVFSWDTKPLADFTRRLKKAYPSLEQPGKIEVGGIAPYFMEDYVIQEFGVQPATKCSKWLDHIIPDPSCYDNDSTYVFSMRSCPNGCSWCVVPRIENEPYIITNWKEQINMKAKRLVICDNNPFSASLEHRKDLFGYLEQIANKEGVRVEGSRKLRVVEFDGGYDWRYMTEENINLIRNIKHSKIRVAWDSVKYEQGFDEAIRMLKEVFPQKSSRGMHEQMECFVLYNCPDTKDTLEDTLYRVYKLYYHYNIFPYCMRYQPLDTIDYKSYLSPYWDEKDCMDVGRWVNNRRLFARVPNFKYFVGRKDDGKTLGSAIDQQTLISSLERDKFRQVGIDFTKSFKENLYIIKRQLEERNEIFKKSISKVIA